MDRRAAPAAVTMLKGTVPPLEETCSQSGHVCHLPAANLTRLGLQPQCKGVLCQLMCRMLWVGVHTCCLSSHQPCCQHCGCVVGE